MGLQSWHSVASRRTLLSAYSPDAAALGLIIVFLGFRLVLAATLGLGVDESYAIANARELELSYFDHPPLHYWIAHAFMPLVGDGRALRLPFIILFAGSSWLLYRLTRRLFGDWAGVWAVLALNLSAFFTLSAGGWIVPDGALIFFLLAAALTLANAFFPAAAPASPWRSWILAGIYLGLASLAKYQAVLFGFGLLLYLVSVPGRRRVLLHPAPWAGALIALAIFSPVLIWNAAARLGLLRLSGRPRSGARRASRRQCACQRRRPGGLDPALDLRAAGDCGLAGLAGRTSAGTILVLPLPRPADDRVLHRHSALGRQRSAALADVRLADALSDPWRLSRRPRRRASEAAPRRWAIASAALLVVLAAIAVGHAATGYGKLLFPAAFAHGDPTLEAVAWTPLRAELKARGYLDRNDMFVIAPNWMDAGRIDQALDGALPVTVFGDLSRGQELRLQRRPEIMARARRSHHRPHDHAGSRGAPSGRISNPSKSCRRCRSAAPECGRSNCTSCSPRS